MIGGWWFRCYAEHMDTLGRPLRWVFFLIVVLGTSAGAVGVVRLASGNTAPDMPRAVDGVLDARSWNPQRDGVLALAGEWEFYWDQFVFPGDSPRESSDSQTGIIIEQPGLWHNAHVDGEYFPTEGFATLRLRVRVGDDWPERIGVTALEIARSMRLYINNELIAAAGVPGASPQETVHAFRPRTGEFRRNGAHELEVVLHIANWVDNEGGRKNPLYLGTVDDTQEIRLRGLFYEAFIAGALFILGLYNLVLYMVRRREHAALAFAAVCFIFAADVLFTGERIFLLFFDADPFRVFGRLWFIVYYSMPVSMLALVHYLFLRDSRAWYWKFAGAFALLYSLVTLVLPFGETASILLIYHIATMIEALYICLVLLRAVLRRRSFSWIFLLAGAVLFSAVVHDMMYVENMIVSQRLSSAGVLIFAMVVSTVITWRMTGFREQAEQLATELRRTSRSLEEAVEARSRELQDRERRQQEVLAVSEHIQRGLLPDAGALQAAVGHSWLIQQSRAPVSEDILWSDARGWVAVGTRAAGDGRSDAGDSSGNAGPGGMSAGESSRQAEAAMLDLAVADMLLRHSSDAAAAAGSMASPGGILHELHQELRAKLPAGTQGIRLGLLGRHGERWYFAGAQVGVVTAHTSGQAQYYPGTRKALGARRTPADYSFFTTELVVQPGDTLYLYSPTLPLTRQRFIQLAGSLQSQPFTERRESLLAALEQEQEKQERRQGQALAHQDDFTVLAIEV